MLCEELLLRDFDLAQGSHQGIYIKKNITVYCTAKINIVFQSRMHTETAQQNHL